MLKAPIDTRTPFAVLNGDGTSPPSPVHLVAKEAEGTYFRRRHRVTQMLMAPKIKDIRNEEGSGTGTVAIPKGCQSGPVPTPKSNDEAS